MSKLRASITMALDGCVTAQIKARGTPSASAGWSCASGFFPLKAFREMHSEEGGEVSVSSAVLDKHWRHDPGRNVFGPVRGPWPNESWRGWWGEDPPYHRRPAR